MTQLGQPDLADYARAAVATAMAEAGEKRSRMVTDQDEAREATWRERALNAEDALKAAHAEILTQRTRIGELLGQIIDLEAEWTQETIQRITTENTTLKQRVRQLTTDNRSFDERHKAARSTPASRTAASRTSKPRSRVPDHSTSVARSGSLTRETLGQWTVR
ncbi:hypothetical protein ABTY61_34665 [Kitasatospora sp. NPDC096128]|uniref:hypothetical protein n=1 Tax=Kitasatospora sp. NPDC096128 TaxID=3155547 RepID=UPI00332FD619